MVGLFAGLCSMEGHNRRNQGNKYQTFDGKMAAVSFAHRAIQNGKLDYKTPEFELISQGYKRTNSSVDRKQPVTASMLREMHRLIRSSDEYGDRLTGDVLWGSVILAFFFLDRGSELWGPVTQDQSTGSIRSHCVHADNVVVRDTHGRQTSEVSEDIASVEIMFISHKGDRNCQGTCVRHYRSKDPILCPVAGAVQCLKARNTWLKHGFKLGSQLTSTSKGLIRKSTVSKLIKTAAVHGGNPASEYAIHSLRIGGACALLAAGMSDLVIKLMGRWSSWCFTVYTRLKPGMLRDTAECMIRSSSWECHGQGPRHVGAPSGQEVIESSFPHPRLNC